MLKDTEKELIRQALQQTQHVQAAATQLGLHYSTLYRKLKKYGLTAPRGREQKNSK